mmetsp:Transcript_41765/g.108163  ORF Transcript_41765/g.108163 Transcript_41765/m.108163 type:complete len:89 (-) Transcript_41765:105-371(-)
MVDDKSPRPPLLPAEESTCSIVSGKSGRQKRVDANGNVIEKGKKGHHASFVDEQHPGSPVEEVKLVTSYKVGWGGYRDSQPGCVCTLM